jgi:hypothetical protein
MISHDAHSVCQYTSRQYSLCDWIPAVLLEPILCFARTSFVSISTAHLCTACSRLFTVAVSSGFYVHKTLTVRRRIHMVHQVFVMHTCTYVVHRCPPPYPALRLQCEGKQPTVHLAFATQSRALDKYRSWYSRFTCAAGYRLLYPIWRLLSIWAYLCVDAGSVMLLWRVCGLRCSTCACEGQSHGFVSWCFLLCLRRLNRLPFRTGVCCSSRCGPV